MKYKIWEHIMYSKRLKCLAYLERELCWWQAISILTHATLALTMKIYEIANKNWISPTIHALGYKTNMLLSTVLGS